MEPVAGHNLRFFLRGFKRPCCDDIYNKLSLHDLDFL